MAGTASRTTSSTAPQAMTGVHKVAILLVSLDKESAGNILKQLNEEDVESVTREIAHLSQVSEEQRQEVVGEFHKLLLARAYTEAGGLSHARSLLTQSLPKDEAERIITQIERQYYARPFTFLQKAEAENLLTFIQDEHPQTIALVLSHLEPAQAAEVLKGLPRARQVDVVRRMAVMETINPDVVREVEATLEKRMSAVVTQRLERTGGVETVAEILNLVDRSTERGILESLEAGQPELVEEIRHLMFVFEDILLVDDRGVQQVLKNIETQDLALALKTAGDEVKEKIFRNMSDRAALVLKEEMDYMGPVRLREVEAAQQRIADVVRRLEEAGQVIILGRGGEEAVVV